MAKISTLVDQFTSTIDSSKWFDWGGARTTIDTGRLKIATNASGGYYGINSNDPFDLTDSSVYIELVDVGDLSLTSYEVYPISLSYSNENFGRLEWMITDNTINALRNIGTVVGDNQNVYTATYNPSIHKWFRIRESGSHVYWETSVNGSSWTVRHTENTVANMHATALLPNIMVGTWREESSTTYALFDNFNYSILQALISGTFTLSGGVNGTHDTDISISGTFEIDGSVVARVAGITRETTTKKYVYKIYDHATGNFLGIWNDVNSEFAFSQEINSAGSAIDVTLARTADSLVGEYEALSTDDSNNIQTDSSVDIAAETTTRNSVGPGTNVDLNHDVKIYVFPNNVDSTQQALVELWGGGGAGGGRSSGGAGGGGGGGQYCASFVDIVPGQTYSFTIGSAVNGTTGDGATGNDSTFETNIIVAKGGGGGLSAGTGGAGGGTGGLGTGDFKHNGGDGGDKSVSDASGGGGEGGGSKGVGHNGGDAVGTTAGSGGTGLDDGGDGGAGDRFAIGHNGTAPGGAGGGGSMGGVAKAGGNGASGKIKINYDGRLFEFTSSGTWTAPAPINGQLIFTGYISKYVTRYGSTENTVVTLMSYGADLDNWVLERSGDTRVPYNEVNLPNEPSDILKDALDLFNADNGIPSYNQHGQSIDITGTAVSYTFNVNTLLEVIKKCLELSPTDWYWWYDMAYNDVHFHVKSNSTDHTFVLGKHILSLDLEQYIEDITNTVYFTGGDDSDNPGIRLYRKYERATSISTYRRGVKVITDNRVTVSGSADIIVGSILDRGENPRYRTSIRISDRVYDIESIKIGQIVGFKNFGNFVDSVTMQVVRIDYNPDFVQLQLDTLLPSVPKRVEDIKRNLQQEENQQNPDAPTIVP